MINADIQGHSFAINLFLVRHGEILSNIKRVYAGKSPEPLTEKGRSQAYETGRGLRSFNIDALYTSPIKRAVETAEIIGRIIDKEYIVMDEFREMELGPWEGLSEDEIARLYPQEWKTWQKRPAELFIDGRETLYMVLDRALSGIKEIVNKHSYSNIIIVTHVAIIRVLILCSQNKSLNLYKTIDIPNGGIFRLSL
ncbi:MAG: histidine phosphatase family protein [Thermodesulfovibrionia bacterium]